MDGDTSISASAKVVDIMELLENILLHVQPDYIPALKRVSKTWKVVIETYPRIQSIIQCLSPAESPLLPRPVIRNVPGYRHTSPIAINSVLESHEIYVEHRQGYTIATLSFGIFEATHPGLQKLGEEMVTRPFCQELQIHHAVVEEAAKDYPTLYRRVRSQNGVRIKHLLKACEQLSREYRKFSSEDFGMASRQRHRSCFVVHFQEEMTGMAFTTFKKALQPKDAKSRTNSNKWHMLQKQWPAVMPSRIIKDDSEETVYHDSWRT